MRTYTINELQSKTIDFLRFPLIIGVIFIHNASTEISFEGEIIGINASLMPVFYYSSQLFSEVIARIAVPLFFFISGFLFYNNIEKLTKESYITKLKSRFKTLFIPYVFWNLVVILIYLTIQNIPSLDLFLNREIKLQNLLSYFWNNQGELKESLNLPMNNLAQPVSYQFWFIRDLMVTVIISPILYFMIKQSKNYIIILFGLLWFFNYWFKIPGLGITAIFFFSSGAYFGINKRNIIDDFSKIKNITYILTLILIIIDLLSKEWQFNTYVHKLFIISGIVSSFNLISNGLKKNKIKSIPFLSAASFFVFATHEPLLKIIRKLTFLILRPSNEITLIILYFTNVIIVVFITLCGYWILKKLAPKFTAIITGGR